jgi:hypothetical protein
VTGTVTDQADQPVGGATIKIHLGADPTAGPPAVTSDKKGKFEIEKLAYGDWTIAISAPGFEPQTGAVPLSKELSAPNVTVKLAPENVAGRAIDAGNQLTQHKYARRRRVQARWRPSSRAASQPPRRTVDDRQIDVARAVTEGDRTINALLAANAADPDAAHPGAARRAGMGRSHRELKVAALQPGRGGVDFCWVAGRGQRSAEAGEYLAKAPGKIDGDPINMGINTSTTSSPRR